MTKYLLYENNTFRRIGKVIGTVDTLTEAQYIIDTYVNLFYMKLDDNDLNKSMYLSDDNEYWNCVTISTITGEDIYAAKIYIPEDSDLRECINEIHQTKDEDRKYCAIIKANSEDEAKAMFVGMIALYNRKEN